MGAGRLIGTGYVKNAWNSFLRPSTTGKTDCLQLIYNHLESQEEALYNNYFSSLLFTFVYKHLDVIKTAAPSVEAEGKIVVSVLAK
jgi:hypothetical protein